MIARSFVVLENSKGLHGTSNAYTRQLRAKPYSHVTEVFWGEDRLVSARHFPKLHRRTIPYVSTRLPGDRTRRVIVDEESYRNSKFE